MGSRKQDFKQAMDDLRNRTLEMERAKEKSVYEKGYSDAIDDYTEWLRKAHANFDEDYAEDIKSDYLDWLKEQNNEQRRNA